MCQDIIKNAFSVFLGIIMVLVFLWIIGIILYFIYEDRFFSKEAQEKYKQEIKKYMKSESEKK